MSNLWERMGYLYGHKFTATYGELAFDGEVLTPAAQTWAYALTGITTEQLSNGLQRCIDSGEAWPPTLPEFVKMCKGKAENEFGLDYTPEYYRVENNPERVLESDEVKANRKKAAKAGVAAMKSALKNGSDET